MVKKLLDVVMCYLAAAGLVIGSALFLFCMMMGDNPKIVTRWLHMQNPGDWWALFFSAFLLTMLASLVISVLSERWFPREGL